MNAGPGEPAKDKPRAAGRYVLPCEVRFNDIDHRHWITPESLFGFLQEAAIRHADERGFGGPALVPRGLTWVLNRLHLRIGRYPRWQEHLEVQTWPSTMDSLYATREFLACDGAGAVLARGTSRWVVVDFEARRAVRIPEDIRAGFTLLSERAIDDSFKKMKDDAAGSERRTFHVRRGDLDANRHANSGRYLEWMLESVPLDVYDAYVPMTIEILYRQEALEGDIIEAVSGAADPREPGSLAFTHTVHNETRSGVAAIGRSQWKAITT